MAEEQFLAAAVDAAKSTGEIIRNGFHLTKNVEHNGQVDLVTETDKAYEDLIFNHLRKLYPEHKFIGEETSAVLGTTADLTDDPTWIVDPLDGTTNCFHEPSSTGVVVSSRDSASGCYSFPISC